MGVIEIEVDPLPCKWCRQPLEQRRWWAPKRFCGRWHRLKYRVMQVVGFVVDLLT
ncbi:hypothetical protein ACFYU9_06425 [Streptomyces sp. NPDC004327]|uniref:hypothetical protein n=1 Tax=Streptomyces sp. NPDC004327 TaxID=3364699 RepID=UPI0036A452D4